MKHLFIIILFFSLINSIAQDKIYLDKDWKKTTEDKAHFYRVLEKKSDSLFYIEDYYISGKMQMDGYFSNLEKETLVGKINWYDEQGIITITKTYTKGILNGDYIEYANGKVIAKGNYKNGEFYDGILISSSIYSFAFSEYKKGKRIKGIAYYSNPTNIAKERYYSYDNKGKEYPTKDVFYDKKSQIIGTP